MKGQRLRIVYNKLIHLRSALSQGFLFLYLYKKQNPRLIENKEIQMTFTTTFSTPKAPTPEKQAEFDALMQFLIDRANATAQGKGLGPRMTEAQSAVQDEMLELASVEFKEADAFDAYKEVLEAAFKVNGLSGVIQLSNDAVTHAKFHAAHSEQEGLTKPAMRVAIAKGITGNWAPGMLKCLAEQK